MTQNILNKRFKPLSKVANELLSITVAAIKTMKQKSLHGK